MDSSWVSNLFTLQETLLMDIAKKCNLLISFLVKPTQIITTAFLHFSDFFVVGGVIVVLELG